MFLSTLFKLFFVPQLAIGTMAPQFSGDNQHKKKISLSDYAGQKIVVYFYPKDNTPGCTAQACNLRDNMKTLTDKGIVVLGISTDNVSSHEKFSADYQLPFSIIADADKTITKLYGVEMAALGMSKRTTFLINEKGIIEHIITSPDTRQHTEEILRLWYNTQPQQERPIQPAQEEKKKKRKLMFF